MKLNFLYFLKNMPHLQVILGDYFIAERGILD